MHLFTFLSSKKGIAPITVVTHRDTMETEEECENALYEASAATGSSPSHTFFVANYTKKEQRTQPGDRAHGIRHFTLRAVDSREGSEDYEAETEKQRGGSRESVLFTFSLM